MGFALLNADVAASLSLSLSRRGADAFDEASRKVTGHPVRSSLRTVLREAAQGGPGLGVAGPNARCEGTRGTGALQRRWGHAQALRVPGRTPGIVQRWHPRGNADAAKETTSAILHCRMEISSSWGGAPR